MTPSAPRPGLAVAVVAAVLLSAAWPEAQGALSWTYAASDHFEVYTTSGGGRAREALAHYEGVHAFFTRHLKLSPGRLPVARLIVFSSEHEFAPYRPNEFATAFYQSGPSGDAIVMRSLDRDSTTTVVHEYAHLMFRRSGAAYPLWLNEGLADYFSTVSIDRGRATLGIPPLGRLRALAGGAALLPLPRLFAIDRYASEYNSREHAGLFYSQSWALTHMLLSDARYRPNSDRFLDLMASGAPSGPTVEATFGRPLTAILRDLEAYVRRDRFSGFRVAYQPPEIRPIWPTRPASGFEGGLVTANLLADRPDRVEEARAAFDALARERPDDLALVESRAHFELDQAGLDAAAPLLERAVALGTRSADLYRAYASAVVRSDPARAESLLTQAVVLDPGDVETRLDLATMLLADRRSAAALDAIRPVTRVPDESAFVYYQVVANASAHLGRLDDALAAAARVVEFARGDDEVRHAAGLQTSLRDFAAARAEVERALQANPGSAPGAAPPVPSAIGASTRSPASGRNIMPPPLELVAQGRLTNVTCGQSPILEVTTAKGVVRLIVDDPLLIKVEGAGSVTVDLACGRQDTPVRVGYEPAVDDARRTVGKVRLLDYR